MIGTIRWGRSEHPFKGASFEHMLDPNLFAAGLNAVIDQLETDAVPQQQIYHMQYKNLVGDTMAEMAAMYQHLGLKLSEQGRRGMTQYLADHPRDARPAHQFNSGSDDVVQRARQAYQRYQAYFGVGNE